MAPKLDAPLTLNEDADKIAAFKSRSPVIPIAPTAFVPPTIPSNLTALEPTLNVKFLAVELDELTVPPKLTTEFVVVKVLAADNVVAPV